MNAFIIITTLMVVLTIGFTIVAIHVDRHTEEDGEPYGGVAISTGVVATALIGILICGQCKLKVEAVRQDKERDYLTFLRDVPDLEKNSINERILNYNAWINDVNAEKEALGWFAWHCNFDMTNHNYIAVY